MTILELREARNKAWEGAKAFVESKRDKDGLLSKEDAETYNAMEEKIKNYSKEIERMEEMENMENELNKPVNSPIVNKPLKADNEVKTGRASNEYKDAMLNALRSNFRQVSNVLQEGVDADGGYLVPDEYDTRLIQKLEDNNIVRALATKIKTSGEHKINIASTTPAAAWIEEGGTLTFGDAKFEQKILDAHKLHVAVKVTEELLYDNAFGLENFLIDSFGKAIGNAEENAFLNGTGNGQPTGIFDETAGGTYITTEATEGDAIIELVYSLKRAYRKNAAFILNDKMIAKIRTYKDHNGAYMWQPSLIAGEPDKLLGYPVYTSQYAPEDSIAFGDFSYRGARSFKQLTELFAGNGMIGYVAKERVDGILVLPEAVQILKIEEE